MVSTWIEAIGRTIQVSKNIGQQLRSIGLPIWKVDYAAKSDKLSKTRIRKPISDHDYQFDQ